MPLVTAVFSELKEVTPLPFPKVPSTCSAVLLSVLAAIGGSCFGLVLRQLSPQLQWWPLMLVLLGPAAGWIYTQRAARTEALELRLLEAPATAEGSNLRLRAHRDELIAIELELAESLELSSDGSLLSSPI